MTAGVRLLFGLAPLLLLQGCEAPSQDQGPRFTISLSEQVAGGISGLGLQTPIIGRAFVIVAREREKEPRLGTGVTGNPLWGVDVRDFSAGHSVIVADGEPTMRGYPFATINELPPGEYYAQAFLNVYTIFHRADGHLVEAHLNSGAHQKPFEAPGNAYSEVQKITVSVGPAQTFSFELSNVIPPNRPLKEGEVLQQGNYDDTEWVRYVKIRSEKLSEFWGRDIYIGANILLPPGYEDHPDVRYPVLYMQGHSSGLTPMPWSPEEWFYEDHTPTHVAVGPQLDGFYDAWTKGELGKIVVITFRDANPFFDTSYSVNTENVGPYGDALTEELMPFLEENFHIVDQPWGRVLAGRSTGGWEAAAMMVFYPDMFAGSFPWAPDPIDFRKLMQINIYENKNAFLNELDWISTPLPAQRETDGLVNYFIQDEYRYEQTVANKGRSGGQWAIWQALYSPVGPDGYPMPLWDPETGAIDPTVAEYWREHWDLSYILERDWTQLGPRLKGKLHFAVGMTDNYYLEEAVYLTQERLEALTNPPAYATFQYGFRGRHSWIGHSSNDPERQMTYAEFIDVMADYVIRNAPAGADIESWKY